MWRGFSPGSQSSGTSDSPSIGCKLQVISGDSSTVVAARIATIYCIELLVLRGTSSMRLRSFVVASVLAANTAPSVAQDEQVTSGFYLAPIVHAVLTDSDREIDDAAAFTLAAGFEVHARWNVELNLFRGHFDRDAGGDLDLDAVGINALRVFRRDEPIAPYALLGIGAQRADANPGDSSTDAYGDVGGGLLTTFRRSQDTGRALSLRLDARARYDRADGDDRVDYLIGLGLQYAFGGSRAQPKAEPTTPLPAVPSQPTDGDRDGVPDQHDRCLDTPPGQPVGADGCEPDTDADDDAVTNEVDNCPNTPRGTRVDARGCELRDEIRLPLVTFEYGSDRLEPDASATLDEAAATLRLNPDLRVEVAGHTDARGSDPYNLDLSQRRAETVRRYLLDKGVTNALTARGYGERDPISDNTTDAGRAENRRVVLRILSQ